MKKKGFILFCVLIFVLAFAQPALAVGTPARLDDAADLLTDAEAQELTLKLDGISEKYGMDVVIVTVEDLYGEDVTAMADDYYDENGYAADGVLLLISAYDREWAVSTTGFGITAFTDAGLDYMAGRFVNDLSDGDYNAAFHTFADLSDDFILQAREGRPYDVHSLPKKPFRFVRMLLISLGVGLFVALLATGTMKSKLKTVYSQPGANQCVKPGSLSVTESREIFLYRQVLRNKRSQSSSGGSSTHTSSSGRTHGGASGKF